MEYLTPAFLDGLGTVGTWAVLGLCLIFDKGLALKREVKQRDKTIDWQRQTIAELSDHIREFTLGTSVAAKALTKVADAAIESGGSEGP